VAAAGRPPRARILRFHRHGAPAPRQPAAPARARPVNWKVIAWVVSVIILAPALGVAFFATYYGSFFILLLFGFGAATVLGTPPPPGVGRHNAS